MKSDHDEDDAVAAAASDCTCRQFRTPDDILSALKSKNRFETLVEWLSEEEELLHDGDGFVVLQRRAGAKASCRLGGLGVLCPNRLSAAFVVLNAIRDGCRPHLHVTGAASVNPAASPTPAAPKPKAPKKDTYEDAFPSLSSASSSTATITNVLVGRSKAKQKAQPKLGTAEVTKLSGRGTKVAGGKGATGSKGPKRRIRPAPVAIGSAPPWGVAGMTATSAKGNISALPSECPVAIRKMMPSSSLPPPAGSERRQKHTGDRLKASAWASKSQDESSGSAIGKNVKKRADLKLIPQNSDAPPAQPNRSSTNVSSSDPRKLSRNSDKSRGNLIVTPKKDRPNGSALGWAATGNPPLTQEELERLARLYSLLLRKQLVPSISLEIHLLVRLLTASANFKKQVHPSKSDTTHGISSGAAEEKCGANKTQNDCTLVFENGTVCRDFAVDVLSRIQPILINLGHEMIKAFAGLGLMHTFCPELVLDLKTAVNRGSNELIFDTDQRAIAGNTSTPLLTLPFDQVRDSRHNYRSVDLNRLFKNREESRDAFMYQLRAFQDVRGKLLDPGKAERSMQEIKHASRETVRNLFPGNLLWFSEFFCDLLLQLGLVPMEETDKEILSHVADKDRLQKLHRRFTSTGGHTNKSSQKLVLDRQKHQSSGLAAIQPEQYFSGHQEYFFLFLESADSHQLCVHLCRRLVGLICNMSSVNDTKGMEQRLLKLQLLAKFLGYLVFSPNYEIAGRESTGVASAACQSASDDAVSHLNCTLPILDVKRHIEGAWEEFRLIITIPWVVGFLRMARWDLIAQSSAYYISVFALLRSIHRGIACKEVNGHSYYHSNMTLVALQLEILFSEVIGLVKTESLPAVLLPSRKQKVDAFIFSDQVGPENSTPDLLPLYLSKALTFSSCPHLEELHKLIVFLTHNKQLGGSSPSKKMRPLSLSSDPSSRLEGVTSGRTLFPDTERLSSGLSPVSPSRDRQSGRGGIEGKLVDTFFHQHKDLQELCDFTIDFTVKNMPGVLLEKCIAPYFENAASSYRDYFCDTVSPMTLEAYNDLIQGLEGDAKTAALALMHQLYDDRIRKSIRELSPPTAKAAVIDVAASLAIKYAARRGARQIESLIQMEAKKKIDEFKRKQKKFEAGVPVSSAKGGANHQQRDTKLSSPQLAPLNVITAMLRDLSKESTLDGSSIESLESAVPQIHNEVRGFHESQFFADDTLDASMEEFQDALVPFLELLFSSLRKKRNLSLVLNLLGIVSVLGKNGWRFQRIGDLLCTSRLSLLITCCAEHYGQYMTAQSEAVLYQSGNEEWRVADAKSVMKVMIDFVEGQLISTPMLERSLLAVLDEFSEAEKISKACLDRLSGGEVGDSQWVDGRVLVMIRLRRTLEKRNRPYQSSNVISTS